MPWVRTTCSQTNPRLAAQHLLNYGGAPRTQGLPVLCDRMKRIPHSEKLRVSPKPAWRCSQLHTRERKHRGRIRDKVRFMPVFSRRKHVHHWNKSLAGGFRCDCEAWRCEFAEGIQQCEIASEQGRKYCLTHLVRPPTSLSAIKVSRTSTTIAKP